MRYTIPILLALSVVGVACGDDDASPVCDARDDLEASVEQLREVDVVDDGLDALRDAIAAVSDDLSTLRAEAASDLEPEIDAVRSALDDLRSAVESGGSPAEVAQSTVAGFDELSTSWNELTDAAQSVCD